VSVTIEGTGAGFLTQQELGANVHMAEVEIPPGSTRTVAFELVGPVPSWPYVLELVPQATANPDRLSVRIDGLPGAAPAADFSGRWVRVTRAGQGFTTQSSGPLTERDGA
jgi:hypothetical protein